ncbi:MAG: N-6 DNA methylase [Paludibacter sp.]|nr:N-6 DNA methylase [Paludibacter sp.]
MPYRDPETLKLFLKTIGEFEYTHSEKLGDAFEYLLSVMGSQGDAGQFRTPRHIIDFLVAIIDPDKTDTILDPACGTAGFLISAYKHILLKYSKDNKQGLNIYEYNKLEKKPFNNLGDQLTPDDRKKLIQNFVGYDISPDMVRLSLVNLYLHGFNTPNIHEYDTLSSEDRWNESFDVVLANPPFMSPKGGIRPHKKFTISSNRSEVLFVDYIAEHLNPNGKSGIIVPEGIIFQSGTAYKDLRKMLVENHLYAVVSLPAGVFNPYSGVKTSILLMDKEVAKKREEILFIKIDNDGYNLGAQRTAVSGSQLEDAIKLAHAFVETGELEESDIAHLVPKTEIAKKSDYYLNGESYKKQLELISEFPIVDLRDLVEIKTGKKDVNQGNPEGTYPFFTCAKEHTFSDEFSYDEEALLVAGNGDVGAVKYFKGKFEAYQRTYILSEFRNVLPKYLYYFLDIYLKEEVSKSKLGNTMPYIKLGMLQEFKVPLPPIKHQAAIVNEIEGYQKILDGANAIITNYKPKIDIDIDWELKKLGEISEFKNGLNFTKSSSGEFIKVFGVGNFKNHLIAPLEDLDKVQINENLNDNYLLQKGDILFVRSNGNKDLVGRSVLIPEVNERISFSGFTIRCRLESDIEPLYIAYLLKSDFHSKLMKTVGQGANIRNLSQGILNEIEVPIPPIEIQKELVKKLNKEQDLVNANKQLIEIFEQKLKDRISKVWGE